MKNGIKTVGNWLLIDTSRMDRGPMTYEGRSKYCIRLSDIQYIRFSYSEAGVGKVPCYVEIVVPSRGSWSQSTIMFGDTELAKAVYNQIEGIILQCEGAGSHDTH